MRKGVLLTALAAAVALGGVAVALFADDHGHGRKERHGQRDHDDDHRGNGRASAPATSQAHQEACGSCHFAYPAGLLPAASWERLLAGLNDHFGQPVPLSGQGLAPVRDYLTANAADRSGARLARKFGKGLGGEAPLRVTQTPYFQRKHRKVSGEVFARAAVGGAGNCPACHPAAAQGDYEDDRVAIPPR